MESPVFLWNRDAEHPEIGELLQDRLGENEILAVDSFGNSSFSATIPKGLAGYTVYLQVAATELSNALAIRFVR